MMTFNVAPDTEYEAGALDDGTRVGVEIADATLLIPDHDTIPMKQLRIHGSQHDMRRLMYALVDALDKAETLTGIDLQARTDYVSAYHWSDDFNVHECDFGPGQNDSRCPRCM